MLEPPDSSVTSQRQHDVVTPSEKPLQAISPCNIDNNNSLNEGDITNTVAVNESRNQSSLLDFVPSASPVFTLGSVGSETFCHSLEATYSKVFHWR